jgi:hypothetical protein
MRASIAKHSKSCRSTASIAIVTALFVLAAAAQALAPAPAVAMDGSETGPRCVSLGIPGAPNFGWNGQEPCEVTNGSGGDGGAEPPLVGNTEPFIEVHDPVVIPPPDDTRPSCPAFGCLRPRPPKGGADRDLFGQVPSQERGSASRGNDPDPERKSQPEICRALKVELPKLRKKLGYLRQDLRSQEEALRLMRQWGDIAPPDDVISGPTALNPRDAEVLAEMGIAEFRQREAAVANILALTVRKAKRYECALDVM